MSIGKDANSRKYEELYGTNKEEITARKIVEIRCESVNAGVFISKAQMCDANVLYRFKMTYFGHFIQYQFRGTPYA